ncbi:MAG TPA: cytochrome c oxidase subunit II [Iamia sp.]|jgi:cytochrome c oxidase subunit 2|nr:cytochrome c oxidase subunit II [Iamia sp.]
MRRTPPARLGVVLATAVGLAGCGGSFGMPDSATEQGDTVLDLWSPAVIAALAVGCLVWGLIVWSVVRYRKRNDGLPTQVEEHIPIEIAYTVVPIVIVVVLFVFGSLAFRDVRATSATPDNTVTVTGFQWSWQFAYEGTDVVIEGDGEGNDGPELVLPVGETTRLDLISVDVAHSFWVPEFLSKTDLIPGVDNRIDVTPTKEGTYRGRCAEFCGLDHWRMYFQVRLVSPEEFDAWLAEQSEAVG